MASCADGKDFTCEICGQAGLASEEDLRSHMDAAHRTPQQCPFCDLAGVTPDQMAVHVDSVHAEEEEEPDRHDESCAGLANGVDDDEESGGSRCPMCEHRDADADRLQEHVNRSHLDGEKTPSGRPAKKPRTEEESPADECPVCFRGDFDSSSALAAHVDRHFSGEGTSSSDDLATQELLRREAAQRRFREQKDFEQLRRQHGMSDEGGGFRQQAAANMETAVRRGDLSVAGFHERRIELQRSERAGADDGRSATRGCMARLRAVCRNTPAVDAFFLAADAVDHHAAAMGDKGWGCGYRNLQMLLSCLLKTQPYAPLLAGLSASGGMPSISRLQELIEAAWARGLDAQGRAQLGGRLRDTRKWIGATEVAAFLTSMRIRTAVVDFHRPSAPDGSHPRLFAWVLEYFRRGGAASPPPLFLQHSGHSRTVVGVEVLKKTGQTRLLIFDPSHSHMPQLLGANVGRVMRAVRKSVLKSEQFQIVAVTGVFGSQAEADAHKVVTSERIP